MALAKTTYNNGYDVYSETIASATGNGTTGSTTSNLAMFCGRKFVGTLYNVSTVTSIATTAHVEVSLDGTNYARLSSPTVTLVTKTTAAYQAFTCDLTAVQAPYVRIYIPFNGTSAFNLQVAYQKNQPITA